jgi:rubredoxin
MADVKIGIDKFTAKLGSDAFPPGAYSSDIRGCQWYQPLISEAHFNIKIVIPALDHYFSAYPIPLERQPLVRETVAALVSLLQALAHTCTVLPDGSGAHEDCATVRRCIDRIKTRGIELSEDVVQSVKMDSTNIMLSGVDALETLLSDSTHVDEDSSRETRRVQDSVGIASDMLRKRAIKIMEHEFHDIVEIVKSNFQIKEKMVVRLVEHGSATCKNANGLKISGQQMMMVSICRLLRHTCEEFPFTCSDCGYEFSVLEGDGEHGVQPGIPFVMIDGHQWSCPKCHAPKSKFISKRSSMQDMLMNAGAGHLVIHLMSALSLHTDLIIAKEPHIMRLLHECMLLGCTLLSSHHHRT